jgi:hypothetical protein
LSQWKNLGGEHAYYPLASRSPFGTHCCAVLVARNLGSPVATCRRLKSLGDEYAEVTCTDNGRGFRDVICHFRYRHHPQAKSVRGRSGFLQGPGRQEVFSDPLHQAA